MRTESARRQPYCPRGGGENTRFVRGWCLEVHDLAIAKYVAGREKGGNFTRALVRHGMVRRNVLDQRLAATDLTPEIRRLVVDRIRSDFAAP
jgi:hypothetical protein